MKILVINCGSSSLKYQLLDMNTECVLATGVIERIGERMGTVTQISNPQKWPDAKDTEDIPILSHKAAMRIMVKKLTGNEWGVIDSLNEIDALGHRIVQGADEFSQPVLITKDVIKSIRNLVPLAPLHNPAHLTGIETAMELFPDTPAVAVFDTEFHQTMPPKAFMYPLPMELYTSLKVRRYGFHGTSHKYVTKAAADHLDKTVDNTSLITIHLGNGCSMAAVKNGKCVDTTMGLTPLAGLMMGTRCGDIDPAIYAFLAKNRGLGVNEINTMLNTQSGLVGICGQSDMRDIHTARESGNTDAELAFEMFTYRVKKTIGSYLAILGSVDAIVFTAGIGENDAYTRTAVCDGLDHLGISLDNTKNDKRKNGTRKIHAQGSAIDILIVPTNEELEIALATQKTVYSERLHIIKRNRPLQKSTE